MAGRFRLEDILGRASRSPGGCLELPPSNKLGYAQVWDPAQKKVVYAHRAVVELVYGPPQPGQEVLHGCDNRSCVNPEHLRWGTRKENVADMWRRGRQNVQPPRGEKHGMARLNADQVREIRNLRSGGALLRELAERFGVSIANVHSITTHRTWRAV